jgi:hypothetical protein
MNTRIILLLLVVQCAGIPTAFAQSACTEKLLTTSTTASVNLEKPAQKNYDPTRPHPMIFDWTQNYFSLHSNAPDIRYRETIRSPFFQPDNMAVAPLVTSRDMQEKDGWELIRQDFGYEYQPYLPSDPTGLKRVNGLGLPDPVGNPFFILYNRYTGILRVLIAVGQLEAYSAAQFRIQQVPQTVEDLQSSLLYESSDVKPLAALDDFTSAKLMAAAPFINEEARWFYADFPTVYDPCTCLYSSALRIEVNLISQSHITMTGQTEGTLMSITNNQGQLNNGNRSTSFGLTNLIDGGKKAAEAFNSAQGFVNKLIADINANKKEEMEETFDIDLDDDLTEQEWEDLYNSLDPVERAAFDLLAPKYEEQEQSADILGKFLGSLSFLEKPLKAVPFLASAWSVVDFFIGGGKKEPEKPQKVEVQPMAIRTATKLEGNITAEHTYKVITLFTPGAKDNATRTPEECYPLYNQVLGVFNLLKTPKVKAYYKDETEQIDRIDANTYLYKSTATRYYQLEEDVKYVVNPAAGFDMNNIEILASLIFEYDYTIDRQLRSYNRPMLIPENARRYRTRYVPLGCLKDLFLQFLYKDIYSVVSPYNSVIGKPVSRAPRVYLKLLVQLPRADRDKNTQGVLFVGTYPVNITDIPAYNPSQWTTNGPYDDVQSHLVFQNGNVAGRQDAWNTITIDAGADVGAYTSGNTSQLRANFTAGERITVKPGARVHPSSTLRIGLPDVCSQTTATASQQEVINFCTSNAYISARRFSKEVVTGENPALAPSPELLGISPNPSSGVIAVRYQTGAAPLTIDIISSLGIPVATLVDESNPTPGEHTVTFDGTGLPRGVYFCVLRCNGFYSVEKFVLY